MPYWKRLIYESWVSTWELVVGQPVSRLVILGAIILMTIVVYRRWKRIEDYWSALRGSAAFVLSSAALFSAIFIWHVLVITPKKIVDQANADKSRAEAAAEQLRGQVAAPSSTPLQVDIRQHGVDAESREQITTLKKQLDTANETIRALESRSDPLAAPIASAQFEIYIKFATTVPDSGASTLGGPALSVALAEQREISLSPEQPEPLLIADGTQYDIRNNEFRALATMRFDSRLVGKTIRSLKSATFLQLELPGQVPSEVATGTVMLVLNGGVSLTFKLSPNTPSQIMGDSRVFRILDVKEAFRGLEENATRRSPIPNKEASPR